MSYFQSYSNCYHNNHEKADDSSTVFDADTVTPDEVPSLPAMPPLPTLTATATTATTATTDYLYNNNNNNVTISSSPHSSQKESPQSFTSVLLRRINSQRSLAEPSTTTATATRSEGISTNQSSSSSSSKKRPIITNSSSCHQSTKRPRTSSRRKRQQPQDQSYVDKHDSEVEDENGHEDDEPDEAVINQSSFSSQTSTTKLTKHELKWRSKFEELRAYKQLHGHTSVPTSNKELGDWVLRQRHEYKKFKANKKAYITKERIEMLESIDFEWVNPNQGQRNESAWNEHFNELKAYKEEYKNTNVPARWEDNKELGNWVGTQRAEYKKFKANKKAYITKKRIKTLESIGFEWVVSKKYPRKESKWNERFNELKAYKEEYKDTNVPNRWKVNKQLGTWVKNQRKEYKKFQENEKSAMTPERINMLNSIGFQWECRPGPASRS